MIFIYAYIVVMEPMYNSRVANQFLHYDVAIGPLSHQKIFLSNDVGGHA